MTAPAPQVAATTAFRWYLGGMTCWFAGYGMQMILFA